MSDWVEHDGEGMPVAGDTPVHVKTRDGWTDSNLDPSPAEEWIWAWNNKYRDGDDDIIGYRIYGDKK